MSRPDKGARRVVPQPGGEAFHDGEPAPLQYTMPIPPANSRGRLVPVVEVSASATVPPMTPDEDRAYCAREHILLPDRPLVPASEEVATLPAAARAAFAARCAARVAPLRAGVATPEGAAALILAAATVGTPLRRQLRCLRRDFDRLVRLAKERNWADDTPVPDDALGPLWPKHLTPAWAQSVENAKNPAPSTASGE